MANFNLKSYFTFLSRNKAYTAVNVFGLAVSLAFVILIGLYTWQETSVDRQHSKADRIYNIGLTLSDSTSCANCHHISLSYLRKRFPEIEKTCGFTTEYVKMKGKDNFVNAYVLETDSTRQPRHMLGAKREYRRDGELRAPHVRHRRRCRTHHNDRRSTAF